MFVILNVPFVLGAVEANASAAELMAVILLFMGVLMLLNAARSYFSSCTQFGRIKVRLIIGSMIQNKALSFLFPNQNLFPAEGKPIFPYFILRNPFCGQNCFIILFFYLL